MKTMPEILGGIVAELKEYWRYVGLRGKLESAEMLVIARSGRVGEKWDVVLIRARTGEQGLDIRRNYSRSTRYVPL